MTQQRWPHVYDEYVTLAMLHQGWSISRFGDGEVALMDGAAQVREPANPALAAELRAILREPHQRCLLGIPTMDPKSPKHVNWERRRARFLKFIDVDHTPYGSAFITRPDSSPWIATTHYAEQMQALWSEKKVALVCEPHSKLFTVVPHAARKVVHLACPMHETYARIEEFETAIVRGRPDLAILSCGPAATCLAHRLTTHGIQSLDLGSIGGMLARLLPLERLHNAYTVVLRHPSCIDGAAMRAQLMRDGYEVFYCGEKSDE